MVFFIRACLPPKTAFLGLYGPKNGHFRVDRRLKSKTLLARYIFLGIFSIPMCNFFFYSTCLPPKTAFWGLYVPKNIHFRGIKSLK